MSPRWPFLAGLAWFGWQWLAAIGTVDPALTRAALIHFSVCLFCLAAGYYSLSAVKNLQLFWGALCLAFAWVLWAGLGQRFGGLDAVRDWIYSQPDWRNLPPDYLKRIGSNRIFSTLVYPNAFAGVILLLLPVLLPWIWAATSRLPRVGRGVLVGLFAYAAVACLYWTGSKAGWLIAMTLVLVLTLELRLGPKMKVLIPAAVVVLGLTGFLVKFSDYLRRGAPSVDARLDYWRAAVQIANRHPILGTGPATFSLLYRQFKDPQSEMARLAHNDYIEQASDSGWPGFAAYSAFILGLVGLLYRERHAVEHGFALWLACFAWATQGFLEFGLYIPASAWTFFTLLGLLAGRIQRFKSTPIERTI